MAYRFGFGWNTGGGVRSVVVPPVVKPDAPVLTKTSAAGVVPMSWDFVYTNVQVGDVINLYWTVNGVPGVGDSRTLDSDDIIGLSIDEEFGTNNYQWNWPAFETAMEDIEDGDVIEVWETHERDGIESDPSNVLTDTAVLTSSVSYVTAKNEVLNFGYGVGPVSTTGSATPVAENDKVVVMLACEFNGSQSVNGVTSNSGAAIFTKRDESPAGALRVYIYTFDVPNGVTSLDQIAVAVSGSTAAITVWSFVATGAPTGVPFATDANSLAVTNEDPIDVDLGLSCPTDGMLAVLVESGSGATITFTGATALGSKLNNPYNRGSRAAAQNTSANITIRGQAGSGPAFDTIYLAAIALEPL